MLVSVPGCSGPSVLCLLAITSRRSCSASAQPPCASSTVARLLCKARCGANGQAVLSPHCPPNRTQGGCCWFAYKYVCSANNVGFDTPTSPWSRRASHSTTRDENSAAFSTLKARKSTRSFSKSSCTATPEADLRTSYVSLKPELRRGAAKMHPFAAPRPTRAPAARVTAAYSEVEALTLRQQSIQPKGRLLLMTSGPARS